MRAAAGAPSKVQLHILEPAPKNEQGTRSLTTAQNDSAGAEVPERAVSVWTMTIDSSRMAELDLWLEGIGKEVVDWPGFISRDVVFPKDYGLVHIVLTFDSERSQISWLSSKERADWVAVALKTCITSLKQQDGSVAIKESASEAPVVYGETSTPIPVGPPPKYRLFLVVWIFVILLACLELPTQLVALFQRVLNYELSLLLYFYILVGVLAFGITPLTQSCLARWLKAPPPTAPSWSPLLTGMLDVACRGFDLVEVREGSRPGAKEITALKAEVARQSKYQVDLRRHNFLIRQAVRVPLAEPEGLTIDQKDRAQHILLRKVNADQIMQQKQEIVRRKQEIRRKFSHTLIKGAGSEAADQYVTVLVEHHVQWIYIEDYIQWTEEFAKTLATFPGFLSFVSQEPMDASSTLFVTMTRFDSSKHLEQFLSSAVYGRLLQHLGRLLWSYNVKGVTERYLPDALTDILAPQNKAPDRPPAKWKVHCLTTWGIFLVGWPVLSHIPSRLVELGVSNAYARTVVVTLINVSVNVYLLTPFLNNVVFPHWTQIARRQSHRMPMPWRVMDQGFRSPISQALFTGAYLAICGLLIGLRSAGLLSP
eukprot:gb/GEZN01003726.1/.p1 GENE.gb/GEZN01003726.1/~~gb/GEZN01003726.1/.p1  ORF type:complete len:628 (+),score=69.94 gb/GEZN01003726.1/:101-1885(+)